MSTYMCTFIHNKITQMSCNYNNKCQILHCTYASINIYYYKLMTLNNAYIQTPLQTMNYVHHCIPLFARLGVWVILLIQGFLVAVLKGPYLVSGIQTCVSHMPYQSLQLKTTSLLNNSNLHME